MAIKIPSKKSEPYHFLSLAMPESWWLWLAHWAKDTENWIAVTGTDPEPWEVLSVFSEAVFDQFPEDKEDHKA